MKKIISILLSVTLIGVNTVFVNAEELGGRCGASNVYWNLKDGVITFSGSGVATGYNRGEQPYAEYIEDITKAVFESGVTGVGPGALIGAVNLCEVELANTVTIIRGSAFYDCDSLKEINVPGALTAIEANAFNSSGLQSISVNQESRFTVGESAFAFCGGIKSFEIPYGAVSIGVNTFNNCQAVKKISVPETVETISDLAFRNCVNLSVLEIPDTCTQISDNAIVNSSGGNLNAVIVTPYNSYAHGYAKEKGFAYSFSDEVIVSDWIFADFEKNQLEGISAVNAQLSRVHTKTPDNSRGTLCVAAEGEKPGVSFEIEMKSGDTYRLSTWIKNAGEGYFEISFSDETVILPLELSGSLGDWSYAETEYKNTHNETAVVSFVGDSGEYFLDNLSVVPVHDDVSCLAQDNTFNIETETVHDGYYYEIYNDEVILKSGTTSEKNISYAQNDAEQNITFRCMSIGSYEKTGDWSECETVAAVGQTQTVKDESLSARIISESFNLGESDMYGTFGSPDITYTTEQRNGIDTGVMGVAVNTAYDSPKFNFTPVKNEMYEVSAWVKLDADEDIKNPALFAETYSADSGAYIYDYIENRSITVKNGEWTKITFDYFHDGMATLAGTGGTKYECVDNLSLSLRLGNGTGFTYLLDDFRVVPKAINADIRIEGKTTVGDSLVLDCLSDYETEGYIYTVKADGITLLNGFTADGRVEIPINEGLLEKKIYAEASAVADGKIGDMHFAESKKITYRDDYTESKFYSEVIGDKELKGISLYESQSNKFSPVKYIGMYSDIGKLVGVKRVDDNEFDIKTDSQISSARLFIFDKDSQKPLNDVAEIKKAEGNIVWVDSVKGDDENDAGFNTPIKTITEAKERVRELLPTAVNDIYVMFKSGVYNVEETLTFDSSDWSENVNVIYTTYGKEQAYISGGKQVSSEWELYDESKNIYRAYVGEDIKTRQLYVNGVRAERAKSEKKLIGLENGTYDEIGHTTTDTSLLNIKYPKDLEMVYFQAWTNPRCPVDSIYEENGLVRIKMNEIGWTNLRNKNNYQTLTPKVPAYYENAYELLDEEREWYLNTHDGYLYYKPAVFEDLKTAEVVIPTVERLINIVGTTDNYAANITFKNIGFKYATWLRPSTDIGHSDAQNNKIRDGLSVEYHDDGTYTMNVAHQPEILPDAAVEVCFSKNINFIDCTFSKLGGIGLKMVDGVKEFKLSGNRVYDISGNGICIGEPSRYYEPDTEDTFVIRDVEITDNIIYDTGEEYKSASGLSVSFAKNCLIKNNEIFNTSYCGIHIGHCPSTYTQNLRIEDNYVHDCFNEDLGDGGAIYHSNATLGQEGNWNIISGNYVRDIMNNVARIAFDNESSGYKAYNNVLDATRIEIINDIAENWMGNWEVSDIATSYDTVNCYNNFGTLGALENGYITDHTVCKYGKWSDEALAVIEKAGLNKAYSDKFSNLVRKADIRESYEVYVGETFVIDTLLYGYKDSVYSGSDCEIYISDVDSSYLKLNEDMSLEAVGAGETEFTLYILSDDTIKVNKIKAVIK